MPLLLLQLRDWIYHVKGVRGISGFPSLSCAVCTLFYFQVVFIQLQFVFIPHFVWLGYVGLIIHWVQCILLLSSSYLSMFPGNLVLTDLLGKHVMGIRNTEVVALSGYTISGMADRIAFGMVKVSSMAALLIHVGTNDIPPLSALLGHQVNSFQAIRAEYKALIDVMRSFNSLCYTVMSAIIPRPVDHVLTWYRVQRVNDGFRELCELNPHRITTYKFFVKWGQPQEQYYSQRGRLHLQGAGMLRLRQAFQQALAPKNVAALRHWRCRATVVTSANWLSTCRGDVGPGSTPSSDSDFHGKYSSLALLTLSFGSTVGSI